MGHPRWNPPLDELQLIADAVGRVLDSEGHERIRDVLRDVDALEEAVDRLEGHGRFRPGRFDRRKLNRRLKQYGQGDEGWLWGEREAGRKIKIQITGEADKDQGMGQEEAQLAPGAL